MVKISEIVDIIGKYLKKKVLEAVGKARSNRAQQAEIDIQKLMNKHNIREDQLDLPYTIEDGKLSGKFSIACNQKQMSDWNMALKFLLIDCAHLIML